jgi:hypothetical protein
VGRRRGGPSAGASLVVSSAAAAAAAAGTGTARKLAKRRGHHDVVSYLEAGPYGKGGGSDEACARREAAAEEYVARVFVAPSGSVLCLACQSRRDRSPHASRHPPGRRSGGRNNLAGGLLAVAGRASGC